MESPAESGPVATTEIPQNVAAPAEAPVGDDGIIREGMNVVLFEMDDKYSFVKVGPKTTCKVGKKYVKLAPLIGARFGSHWELRNGQLAQLDHDPHQEDEADPEAVAKTENVPDNRNLVDDNSAQQLTAEEIHKMRTEGGAVVIQKLIENSATFQQKTEFSKAKYLKRKKKKYIITVQARKPTARVLCEAHFTKTPFKIRNLRNDSLAQLMLHSDAKSGSRVLTYDRCGGMVVGALLERLAGSGTVINIFPGVSPALGIVDQFNFTKEERAVLKHLPIRSLPNFPAQPSPPSTEPAVDADLSEPAAKKRKTEDGAAPVETAPQQPSKRNGFDETVIAATLQELVDPNGPGIDSLVIVPEDGDDPVELLRLLYPYVSNSGSIVMFSPYLQLLADCYQDAMESHSLVHVRLFETWCRISQVLPMRTHPTMQMHGASGYLLTGYKVKSSYGLPIRAATAASSSSTTTVAPSVTAEAMDVDVATQ